MPPMMSMALNRNIPTVTTITDSINPIVFPCCVFVDYIAIAEDRQ